MDINKAYHDAKRAVESGSVSVSTEIVAALLAELDRATPPPPERTPRGFALWANFSDLYNKQFTVQQSSLATQDAVWVGAGSDRGHLSVAQARIVRDALSNFIAWSTEEELADG